MLFVEIPEYRNKHIRVPVKVNFYVINGKRKRSQPQHFTYHPGETFSLASCTGSGAQDAQALLPVSYLGEGLTPSETVFDCVGWHFFDWQLPIYIFLGGDS